MVLAVILITIAVAAISSLLAFASPAYAPYGIDRQTHDNLLQAQAALIWRAAHDDDRPGSLPCPDTDNDGQAELFVGTVCPSYIGRLPWRTLRLPDLRDSSGERLWYALSPSLTDHPAAEPINSDTTAALSISGTTPIHAVAAVIIAPGEVLNGQVRTSGNHNNPGHYLEGGNEDSDNAFYTGVASASFNDQLIAITRRQVFNATEWRVANEIRATLEMYYGSNNYLPFANDATSGSLSCIDGTTSGRIPDADQAAITCTDHANWDSGLGRLPPTWFTANDWHLRTYYALAPACAKPTPGCTGTGFLTLNGVPGKRAVVIVGGQALASQTPACIGLICIEQPSAATFQYQRQPNSTFYNDKLALIP